MASRKRQRAVRIGIPALIIAGLTFVALWRVSAPPAPPPVGAPPSQKPTPLPPLTNPQDVHAASAIGRRVLLDSVLIHDIPSVRTLWIGNDTRNLVLAVLDPDVKQSHEARVVAGGRVTLVGLVRGAPQPDVAVRQWGIDGATAQVVQQGGTYLYVTEVRPAS